MQDVRELRDIGVVEQAKVPITPAAVFAVWLQNFGGGIGTFAFVGVLAWQASGSWPTTFAWALPWSIAAFGLLMLARSSIDEIVDYLDYRAMIRDMEALEAQIAEQANTHDEEVDRLNGLIRTLQHDLNIARSEAYAQAAGPHSKPAIDLATERTPADPARNDAQKLLERAYAGQQWGKDAMRTYCGMTSTRWAAARDLLERRGITTKGNKQTYLKPATLSDALTALLGSESAEKSS